MPQPRRPRPRALVAGLALLVLGCGPTLSGGQSDANSVLTAISTGRAAAFNGDTGWRMTASSGLQLTSNSGQAWTTATLPSSVSAADVMAVSTEPGGSTLIAAATAGDLDVLVQGASTGTSWSTEQIVPQWPAGFQDSGSPDSAMFAQAPGGFVDLVLGLSLGSSTELVDNLVSTDAGASFVQAMSRSDLVWQYVTFASPSDGVVVAGPASTFLYCTNDGGASWTSASLPTGFSQANLGQPMVSPSGFLIPATVSHANGGETMILFESTNGQSFTQAGTPLTIPAADNPGEVTAADQGSSIWVFASDHVLFTSTNSGGTWTEVSSASVPEGVVEATLATASTGTAVASTTSCAAYKSDCTSTEETVITTDGGQVWTAES